MEPFGQRPSVGGGPDPALKRSAERLIGALQKAVRIAGYFSTGHQAATAAVDDLVEIAVQTTTEHQEIAFRFTGDGLYVDEERIVGYSHTEDPHLFRLFHHGVRLLAFRAGITRDDVFGFLEAVTADVHDLEASEEDVITALWARNLNGIRWVVIETFTELEADDPQGRSPTDELINFLDEAVRARIGEDLQSGADPASSAAMALTEADVRFFNSEQIGALLEALPKAKESVDSVYGISGAECFSLSQDLERAQEVLASRYFDALIAASSGGMADDDAQATAHSLALALGTLFRQGGLSDIEEVLRRLSDWLSNCRPDDRLANAVCAVVLGGPLLTSTIEALETCSDPEFSVALRVLADAPLEHTPKIAAGLTKVTSAERRRLGFAVLLARGEEGQAALVHLVLEMLEDVALDVLEATAQSGREQESYPIYQESLKHESAEVRGRAVQLLARTAGPDASIESLVTVLFDSDANVRFQALRVMAATKKAAAALRTALQTPQLATLPLTEKRRLAILVAHLEGMRAAPLLHMLLGRSVILGQTQNDEIRAAAAAGLGYIPDPRAHAALDKLAKTRLASSALRNEARKVADALAVGQAAYSEEDLRAMLVPPTSARAAIEARRASQLPQRPSAVPPRASSLPPSRPSEPGVGAPAALRTREGPAQRPSALPVAPRDSHPAHVRPWGDDRESSQPLEPRAPVGSSRPASLPPPPVAPEDGGSSRPASLPPPPVAPEDGAIAAPSPGSQSAAPTPQAGAPRTDANQLLEGYLFEDDRGAGFRISRPQAGAKQTSDDELAALLRDYVGDPGPKEGSK